MHRNLRITFHLAGFALFRCGMTCFLALVDFAPKESSIRQGLFHKLSASLSIRAQGKRRLYEDKHEAGLTLTTAHAYVPG